ncbi:MAG: farnesyl diphosphate synthase [Thermodesulfobacteriota bacterium]|nr:farnesyl diphosphate synthase [Thermodesulfobacteriota bacterium]
MDVVELVSERKKVFDRFLDAYLKDLSLSSELVDCCAYSLKAGGKRLRPILSMLACGCCKEKEAYALEAGLAVELIHTFSLIHDDLPALDNDDLRRGHLTCHKRFGEASAILAGDALIFQAFSVISSSVYPVEIRQDLMKALAQKGGILGLIRGEYADIQAGGRKLGLSEVEAIYTDKTSRLFELSMYMGARVAGADTGRLLSLMDYGLHLGLAFQAIDDILDVTSNTQVLGKTPGKDEDQGKATLVGVLGIQGARRWAMEQTNLALSFIGAGDDPLEGLALWMLERIM